MPLTLKSVEPRRGALWVRDGVALYLRRPLTFTSMLVLFVMSVLVLIWVLPGFLRAISVALLPLLSLGFMVASQSALLGGAVHPRQFVEPLLSSPARRRSLLALCALYALSMMAVAWLAVALSDGAFERMVQAMARDDGGADAARAFAEPALQRGLLVAALLTTGLSMPFWHAPALVHWGGQTAGQALFSSTLAIWRSKGAMVVYGLSWVVVLMALSIVLSVLAAMGGSASLSTFLALLLNLVVSGAFYVSLLFTFNDSFGSVAAEH